MSLKQHLAAKQRYVKDVFVLRNAAGMLFSTDKHPNEIHAFNEIDYLVKLRDNSRKWWHKKPVCTIHAMTVTALLKEAFKFGFAYVCIRDSLVGTLVRFDKVKYDADRKKKSQDAYTLRKLHKEVGEAIDAAQFNPNFAEEVSV